MKTIDEMTDEDFDELAEEAYKALNEIERETEEDYIKIMKGEIV